MFDPRTLSGPFGNVARFNVFGEEARGLLDELNYGQQPGYGVMKPELDPNDHYTATSMSPQYQGPTIPQALLDDPSRAQSWGDKWGEMIGRQGAREKSQSELLGMKQVQSEQLPNPMQTLQGLMSVVGAGGQQPYQNFMPRQQNPWLQGLMNY
jgi:hypothetical protein